MIKHLTRTVILVVALAVPSIASANDATSRNLASMHVADQQAFILCSTISECGDTGAAALRSNSALTRRFTVLLKMHPTRACIAAVTRYNKADRNWMTSIAAFAAAPTRATHDASTRIVVPFLRTIVPVLKAC